MTRRGAGRGRPTRRSPLQVEAQTRAATSTTTAAEDQPDPALMVVPIEFRGITLTVVPGLVDQARYVWELRLVGDPNQPEIRRVQAAQELLVLLFGVEQLDRLVKAGAATLTIDEATELIEAYNTAVHGALSGESSAS